MHTSFLALSYRLWGAVALSLIVLSCGAPSHNEALSLPESFDWQGHRGSKGLRPENSIPAFKHGLELGVNTLELDLVISKDSQVLVSHEPWLSHHICRDSSGQPIAEASEKGFNLFEMTYKEIRACDCGTLRQDRFPEQSLMAVYKPLFSEFIDSAEAHAERLDRAKPYYNVEIKRQPDGDGLLHPQVETFVELVLSEIASSGVSERIIVQCFDTEALRLVRETNPKLPLALLIGNHQSPAQNLEELGFIPEIYSPNHRLVDKALVAFCQEKGMKLIPWTVNELEEMERLIKLGVDGLITDYPNRKEELLANQSK